MPLSLPEQYIAFNGDTDQTQPQAWFASELKAFPDMWDATRSPDELERALGNAMQRQYEFVQALGLIKSTVTIEFRILREPGERQPLRFYYIVGVEEREMAPVLWRIFHSNFPSDLDFRLNMIPANVVQAMLNPLEAHLRQLHHYEWYPVPQMMTFPQPGDVRTELPKVSWCPPMDYRQDNKIQLLRLLTQIDIPLVIGYAIQPVSVSDSDRRPRQQRMVLPALKQFTQEWTTRLGVISALRSLSSFAGGAVELQNLLGDHTFKRLFESAYEDWTRDDEVAALIFEDMDHESIYNHLQRSPDYIIEQAEKATQRLLEAQSHFLWRVHAATPKAIPEEIKMVVGSDLGRRLEGGQTVPYECLEVNAEECRRNYQHIQLYHWRRWNQYPDQPYAQLGQFIDEQSAVSLIAPPILPKGGIPGIRSHHANPLSGWQTINLGTAKRPIDLGAYVDSRIALLGDHGQRVEIDADDLTRHALITGATGSGKTTTCKRLLSQLYSKTATPFMVIEPVKAEYGDLWFNNNIHTPSAKPIEIYEPGKPGDSFWMNPFYVRKGVSINTHINYLKSAFLAAFPSTDILDIIWGECIRQTYQVKAKVLQDKRGLPAQPYQLDVPLNDALEDDDFPTLQELHIITQKYVKHLGYTGEFGNNLKAAVNLRLKYLNATIIGSLLKQGTRNRSSFEASIEQYLNSPMIVQLTRVGNKAEKALMMAFIMNALYEYYESQPPVANVKHVTLIEEAHVLLSNVSRERQEGASNAQGKAIEIFADMLAEIRSRGEGLIIAEQLPSKLIPESIKNTNLKIMHRLTAEDDRRVLGDAMNFDERQSRFATTLGRGQAILFREGLSEPALVDIQAETIDAHEKTNIEIYAAHCREEDVQELSKYIKECSKCDYSSSSLKRLHSLLETQLRDHGISATNNSSKLYYLYLFMRRNALEHYRKLYHAIMSQ